jgi:hypothetical protein
MELFSQEIVLFIGLTVGGDCRSVLFKTYLSTLNMLAVCPPKRRYT